jgi:hypothetical protein
MTREDFHLIKHVKITHTIAILGSVGLVSIDLIYERCTHRTWRTGPCRSCATQSLMIWILMQSRNDCLWWCVCSSCYQACACKVAPDVPT